MPKTKLKTKTNLNKQTKQNQNLTPPWLLKDIKITSPYSQEKIIPHASYIENFNQLDCSNYIPLFAVGDPFIQKQQNNSIYLQYDSLNKTLTSCEVREGVVINNTFRVPISSFYGLISPELNMHTVSKPGPLSLIVPRFSNENKVFDLNYHLTQDDLNLLGNDDNLYFALLSIFRQPNISHTLSALRDYMIKEFNLNSSNFETNLTFNSTTSGILTHFNSQTDKLTITNFNPTNTNSVPNFSFSCFPTFSFSYNNNEPIITYRTSSDESTDVTSLKEALPLSSFGIVTVERSISDNFNTLDLKITNNKNDVNNTIIIQNDKITVIQDNIDKIMNYNIGQDLAIEENSTKISTINNILKNYDLELANLKTQISLLQAKVDAIDLTDINNLKTNVASNTARIITLENSSTHLELDDLYIVFDKLASVNKYERRYGLVDCPSAGAFTKEYYAITNEGNILQSNGCNNMIKFDTLSIILPKRISQNYLLSGTIYALTDILVVSLSSNYSLEGLGNVNVLSNNLTNIYYLKYHKGNYINLIDALYVTNGRSLIV